MSGPFTLSPSAAKRGKLDRADDDLASDPSILRDARDHALRCKELPLRVGVWFTLDQYTIERRSTTLKLAALKNDPAAAVEPFHAAAPTAFASASVTAKVPEPPSLGHIYPVGASPPTAARFEAGLTSASVLVPSAVDDGFLVEPGAPLLPPGYREFNEYLGAALAVHVFRTHTFRPRDTGDFAWSKIERVDVAAATEKFALKVYPYLKARLNGVLGIFPVGFGVISATPIDETEYNKRKLIEGDNFKSGECKSMPLIPGVCQIHILIELSGGLFRTKEVYCDGDCIFP